MSHSHSHAPGEEHCHSHGPQSPQSPGMSVPDPALQARIDQDFVPCPLVLGSESTIALCADHKLEKCDTCDVDFVITNRLSRLLVSNPTLLCPPPSNVVSQKLSQMVQSTKDDGNVRPCLNILLLPTLNFFFVLEPFQSRPCRPGHNSLLCRCFHSCPAATLGGK